MVLGKINQRKAVERSYPEISFVRQEPVGRSIMQRRPVLVFMLLAAVIITTFGVTFSINRALRSRAEEELSGYMQDESSAFESSAITEVEEDTGAEPVVVDLQSVVDNWAGALGGHKSVMIYDLNNDTVAASYNTDENYNIASLYKLFVVYEGYSRLQSGKWRAEDKAGATGRTILECLDLAIRESNSACAEVLWKMIGEDKLDEIVKDKWGIVGSDISGVVSNAGDIAKIMQRFYEHPDITDEQLLARMWDSFLNQPATEYDWRQGLPSGFSDGVKVHNKVGWAYNAEGNYWEVYHDAAIVHFEDLDQDYIVVVMTERVDYSKIAELGRRIENSVRGV